jgi:hypothetical protein
MAAGKWLEEAGVVESVERGDTRERNGSTIKAVVIVTF